MLKKDYPVSTQIGSAKKLNLVLLFGGCLIVLAVFQVVQQGLTLWPFLFRSICEIAESECKDANNDH